MMKKIFELPIFNFSTINSPEILVNTTNYIIGKNKLKIKIISAQMFCLIARNKTSFKNFTTEIRECCQKVYDYFWTKKEKIQTGNGLFKKYNFLILFLLEMINI